MKPRRHKGEKLMKASTILSGIASAALLLGVNGAAHADDVQGVAIIVPDRALGPVVAEKAAKANVKLIAVDDDIKGPNDSAVPYIGMNAGEIGAQVGRE